MGKSVIAVLLLFFLVGCAMLPVEETMPPPVLTAVQEVPSWNTAIVGRHDLSLYTIMTVEYVLPRTSYVVFNLHDFDGIEEIFVSIGDIVNEGDVMARFYHEGLYDLLVEARRDEVRADLDLSQNRATHLQSLDRADTMGITVDDSSYVNRERELRHRLELARFELEYLLALDESLNVRAPLSGMVTEIVLNEDQPNSMAGGRILWGQFLAITVSDHTASVFRIRHPATQHIQLGDVLEVRISQGGQSFDINIVAIDPDELDFDLAIRRPVPMPVTGMVIAERAEAFFVPAEGEQVVVTAGTRGSVVYVIEEALDVIAIPATAVTYLGGQYIVLVIEDGIRVRRDVEVGMTDRQLVEITSGLEPGEVIVQ